MVKVRWVWRVWRVVGEALPPVDALGEQVEVERAPSVHSRRALHWCRVRLASDWMLVCLCRHVDVVAELWLLDTGLKFGGWFGRLNDRI